MARGHFSLSWIVWLNCFRRWWRSPKSETSTWRRGVAVGWFVWAVVYVLLLKRKKIPWLNLSHWYAALINFILYRSASLKNRTDQLISHQKTPYLAQRRIRRRFAQSKEKTKRFFTHLFISSSEVFKGFWISLAPVKASSLFNGQNLCTLKERRSL